MMRYSEIPRDLSGDSLKIIITEVCVRILHFILAKCKFKEYVFQNADDSCAAYKSIEETDSPEKETKHKQYEVHMHTDKFKTKSNLKQKVSSGPGPPLSYYNYG